MSGAAPNIKETSRTDDVIEDELKKRKGSVGFKIDCDTLKILSETTSSAGLHSDSDPAVISSKSGTSTDDNLPSSASSQKRSQKRVPVVIISEAGAGNF